MCYRIVETGGKARGAGEERREVARFDSAYQAMEFMRREYWRRDCTPPPWVLLDRAGQVLMGPEELFDVAA